MKTSIKIILLASCLIGFANDVNAYMIARQPDGSVHIRGCQSQTIGNTDYLCCDNNCQTREYWIKRAYSNDEVNYMTDMAEVEAVDRYTLTEVNVDQADVEYEDNTPALGKIQNKINEVGSELFGLIGL